MISSLVSPYIDYFGNKYDVYNDYTWDEVECGCGFINISCYVGDFNRCLCYIGAVYVLPKCSECLEPSKDPSCLPSLEPSKNPIRFPTYDPTGNPSLEI